MADWPYSTTTWKRLRKAKLAEQPFCEACQLRGWLVMANTVDHVTPISAGGLPFPPLDGLMALCERCHNEKTSGHDKAGNATGRRFKGFDVNGNPIDPQDAWHGGPSDHGQSEVRRPTSQSKTDLLPAKHSQKWVF